MTGADALLIWTLVFGISGAVSATLCFVCGDRDFALDIAKTTTAVAGFFAALFISSIYFF